MSCRNPEFLREGSAIEDTLRPDRIVDRGAHAQVAMSLLELYALLERPMIITDVPSAEMIKYASNAFLATKISFMNAIANICEKAGADVTQVTKGVGLDSRIGAAFLRPGWATEAVPAVRRGVRRLAVRRGRGRPMRSRSSPSWNEFKFLNLERLRSVMRRPAVFDGRNLWEPERMRRLGFEYHLERPSAGPSSLSGQRGAMRILITGGAGFIGSHLARFLLAKGCEVVCMDNFVTGQPETTSRRSAPCPASDSSSRMSARTSHSTVPRLGAALREPGFAA